MITRITMSTFKFFLTLFVQGPGALKVITLFCKPVISSIFWGHLTCSEVYKEIKVIQ